ncbi:hypothetical protein ACFQ9V_16170 [Leifsonia sp. NPDC056665]|uniref:hypothetical protein n=1 Tax=Leifsonia sp. NPDC056665 TaxID=3345901 RepID=UPI0036A0122A
MANEYVPKYLRLDATESSEEAALGRTLLEANFDRLTRLIQSGRYQGFSLAPGSRLWGDDRHTPYNPISYQVAWYAMVAVDHLRFVRDSLQSRGEFAVMAEYTVVRSAIEAAGYGYWLLDGGTQTKRVRNSLRLSWDSIDDVESLLGSSGGSKDGGRDIRTRLKQIQAEGPAHQGSIEDLPTITRILGLTDTRIGFQRMTGLEAWRICSGIAHSNTPVAIALLEHEQVETSDAIGAISRLSNRIGLLATVYEIAMTYLERLLDLWETAATQPVNRSSTRRRVELGRG